MLRVELARGLQIMGREDLDPWRIVLHHLFGTDSREIPKVEFETRTTTEVHDRFVVVDGSSCWYIGCSIKDAGGSGSRSPDSRIRFQ